MVLIRLRRHKYKNTVFLSLSPEEEKLDHLDSIRVDIRLLIP